MLIHRCFKEVRRELLCNIWIKVCSLCTICTTRVSIAWITWCPTYFKITQATKINKKFINFSLRPGSMNSKWTLMRKTIEHQVWEGETMWLQCTRVMINLIHLKVGVIQMKGIWDRRNKVNHQNNNSSSSSNNSNSNRISIT